MKRSTVGGGGHVPSKARSRGERRHCGPSPVQLDAECQLEGREAMSDVPHHAQGRPAVEEDSPEGLPWQQQSSCPPSVQLIKVDVGGTLLLVPMDKDATFEGLAKEVAHRYQEFKGVGVELTLNTREGAMLSKNDPVSLLSSLSGGDLVLVASVTSLTLPPIAESYKKACTASHTHLNEGVSQSLEECQAAHTLFLNDMGLGPKDFGAVAQVVSQHQNLTIRRLSLASNNIGDKGVKLLCQALPVMQSLMALDLSSNGITVVGLTDLASMFTQQPVHSQPLQVLEELNLSHNPIKDSGFPHLVTVLSNLLSLTSLSLIDCSLSSCDLICCNNSRPLSLDSLEQLDVSMNNLGAEGVAFFLATLQPSKLKLLNVSRTLGYSPSPRKIAREVALLLTRDELHPPSNLIELDLSHTLVNDLDLYEIMIGLKNTNSLKSLGLECNPDLTSMSLQRLLQQGSWPKLYISLLGCPRIFEDMEGANWMLKDSLLPTQVSLSVGRATDKDAFECLVGMWQSAVGIQNTLVERKPFGQVKLGMRTLLSLLFVA